MAESLIEVKSFDFALQAINLYKLMQSQREYVLSNQFLRSATSIGANVSEASAAQSRDDFKSKMSIASKEARETKYWLRLLHRSKLCDVDFSQALSDIEEIIRLLTAIVKTTTQNSKLKTQNSSEGGGRKNG